MKIPSEIKNFNDRLFNKASLIFKIRKTVILWLLSSLSFLILLFFSTNVFLNRAEDRAHLYTIDALQTILNSSHQGIKEIWLEGFFIDATLWASDPILLQNTKELLKMPRDSQVLMYSEAMHNIRSFFKQRIKHHNALGIFIISPDYVSLVSMSDQNIGKINLMVNEHKDRLDLVFQGHNQIIPPMVSDIPLPNKKGILVDGYPTMFVVVPIKDTDGGIIAALSIRLDPFDDFSLMAQTSQLGNSGEIYIVNKDGILLTESRFLDNLYKIGILENEEYSMLNVEIRDPGVNLLVGSKSDQLQKKLPFTYAIEQVIKGKSGSCNIAYRDYRGVDVLGVWQWDDDLNIGFVAEIDKYEAMQLYRSTRDLSLGLLAVTIFLMFGLIYINWRGQRKNIRIIEQKERYFRTVLNNAVNGIVIINQKGIIESFNLAAQNIFGYTADEVIGKNVSMLANVKDRNQHDTYLRNYIKTRIPKIIGFNREVIGVRKKGSKFPLRVGVSEIEFKDRMVFMGMITDLTLEKKAEKALYEIEERFKNTFDQAPISIANTDLNGRFQKVNHAFCALFGYSEKELLKMVFGEITFSDDIEESKSRMKDLIDRRIRKFSLEKRYIKKNGKLMWGNVTVSALTDKFGNINNLIAIVEDITEKKHAEQELQKRADELETINTVMLDREMRVIEMKEEVNKLSEKLGIDQTYPEIWKESKRTDKKNKNQS